MSVVSPSSGAEVVLGFTAAVETGIVAEMGVSVVVVEERGEGAFVDVAETD